MRVHAAPRIMQQRLNTCHADPTGRGCAGHAAAAGHRSGHACGRCGAAAGCVSRRPAAPQDGGHSAAKWWRAGLPLVPLRRIPAARTGVQAVARHLAGTAIPRTVTKARSQTHFIPTTALRARLAVPRTRAERLTSAMRLFTVILQLAGRWSQSMRSHSHVCIVRLWTLATKGRHLLKSLWSTLDAKGRGRGYLVEVIKI